MTSTQPFDLKAFKAAWRARLAEVEQATGGAVKADPLEGVPSSAQVALAKALIDKETTYARASNRVRAFAFRHPSNFDNGRGALDQGTIEERCSPQWWSFHASYWRPGRARVVGRWVQRPVDPVEITGQPEDTTEQAVFRHLHEQAMAVEVAGWQERTAWRFTRAYSQRERREFLVTVGVVLWEEMERKSWRDSG